MAPALRNRAFRWIAALYTADTLLEWVGSIALMVLVYEHTQSTTAAAGLLICKQVVPGALIPLAGGLLDRLRLERALAVALTIQAATLLVVAQVGYGAAFFLMVALSGAAGGIARSLLRAAVARRLPSESLVGGNAVLNIAMGVAGFAGPAIAAAAIGAVDIVPTLVATAVGLGCAGVAAKFLPAAALGAEAAPHERSDEADATVGGPQAGAAIPLAGLLVVVGLIACVFAMDEPALLAYSEESLLAGVGGYSAILVAWGIGITLGSVVFTRLTHWPMLRVYAVATILAAVAYIGMSLSPTIALTCAIAVVGGIGNGMDWVAVVTLVQQATPKGREAWAATRLEAIGTAGPGVGILLGGVVADIASPRVAILVPGVLALVALAAAAAMLRTRMAPPAGGPVADSPVGATQSFSPSIHGGPA